MGRPPLSTNEFICRAIEIHGDKYDYSLVDYKRKDSDVKIICSAHGIFYQRPDAHLNNHGCSSCITDKLMTTHEKFVKSSRIHYGETFDYSKVPPKMTLKSKNRVIVICKIHGEFEVSPYLHMNGKSSCKRCTKLDHKNKFMEHFIFKSKEKHGDRYDYSLVEYVKGSLPVKIICKNHGIFLQAPNIHMKGANCSKCAFEGPNITFDEFLQRAIKKHGMRYSYNEHTYNGINKPIEVICSKHGTFTQLVSSHLASSGCLSCANENQSLGKDGFIKRSIGVHGDVYSYEKVIYKNNYTPVEIICKKHGPFLQTPGSHFTGYGCNKCHRSVGETKIIRYLEEHNILYELEKKFDECRHKLPLRFDFYLTGKNILIEFDGIQHFPDELKNVTKYQKEFKPDEVIIRDKIKDDFCREHKIPLIRIKYNESINDKLDSLLFL